MAVGLLIAGAAICFAGAVIGVAGWMQATKYQRARFGGMSAIAVFSGLAVIAIGMFLR